MKEVWKNDKFEIRVLHNTSYYRPRTTYFAFELGAQPSWMNALGTCDGAVWQKKWQNKQEAFVKHLLKAKVARLSKKIERLNKEIDRSVEVQQKYLRLIG